LFDNYGNNHILAHAHLGLECKPIGKLKVGPSYRSRPTGLYAITSGTFQRTLMNLIINQSINQSITIEYSKKNEYKIKTT